jgi:hypothetical protein
MLKRMTFKRTFSACLTISFILSLGSTVLASGQPVTAKPAGQPVTLVKPTPSVKPVQDLPYKVPGGWIPPQIKSTATADSAKNINTLTNELGLIKVTNYSAIFHPLGKSGGHNGIQIGEDPTDDLQAYLTFKYWNGDVYTPYANKVPYIAREIFQFYFPTDYGKVFKIMDDGYNGKDVSPYLNKKLTFDNRQVQISETNTGYVVMYIGKPGVKYDGNWHAMK